jgi:carbonic anhydrase
MNNIDSALERNRAFAAAGGHEGAVVFPKLRLFVITCLDPRVDPAHFLGLGLSDAVVVRNVGGRVTSEVINDVAFIGQLVENVLPDGPLFRRTPGGAVPADRQVRLACLNPRRA